MSQFNYNTMAELFPSRRFAKSQVTQYQRFAKASDAIRYCMEEMPAKALAGSFLEVDEVRYEGENIRSLYNSESYPLPRATRAA